MKKLINSIKYDKKTMTILNVIAITGIIAGSIFVTILSKKDKTLIVNSLNNYFSFFKSSNVSIINEFKRIFLTNFFIIFIIWIIGISVIGVLLVISFIFYKSFILGFSISSLIYTYSYKGAIISFVYIFPHMIINLLIFLFISCYSLKLSTILVKSILKRQNLNFKSFINSYVKIFIISLIFILLTSIYEAVIMPIILKGLIKMIM